MHPITGAHPPLQNGEQAGPRVHGVVTDPNRPLPATMRALRKTTAGPGADLVTVALPEVGPEDVLIRVQAASICGTDLHIYEWNAWAAERVHPPRIFGHEVGGTVAAMGASVRGLDLGDLVSVETHVTCGQCFQCRTGQANVCERIRIVGVDRDGAFAEYVVIPAKNAWKNDPGMDSQIAAIQEPLGNAVYTALSGDIAAKTVAVFGCGPIGIMSVGVARAAGAAAVYAVDVNPYRLQLAQQLGATEILDSTRTDVVAALRAATEGRGVDVALEMSGNEQAVHQAFAALRNGGRISLLGLPSGNVSLDLANEVIFKGVTVVGISGRLLFATWYQGQALQRAGALNVRPVITHQFELARYAEAFELVQSGHSGKVCFLFPPD